MAGGDGVPLNARGGVGDHITGLAALAGILAAVLQQRETGFGRVVEVSLLRTGAYVLGWDLGLQMSLGKVAGAEPRQRNQSPLMNSYCASDGRWFFFTGLEAERHIGAVCRALGRPEWLDDERFSSAVALRRHRAEVIALLDEVIAQRSLAEWSERFDREGVWWAPVQSPAEVVADSQLLANDGFVEVEGGAVRSVNGPVTFSGMVSNPATVVPQLGDHTAEVLAELSAGGRPEPRPRRAPAPSDPGR
jgi:crotonobetainyl-CoA:carnitine CoA-transferase CaiB-like acyl-CoA transferase